MELKNTASPFDAIPAARPQHVPGKAVKVWDLPTRLFHWSLVGCVSGAVVTALVGGNWIDWHLRLGIATLALLVFRLVWGVIGPRYARFKSFLYSPRDVRRYLAGGGDPHAGHSPTGAVAVFAILLVLLLQATTGLFSSDSISTDGPLVRFISEDWVSRATWLHHKLQWAIYGLVALHVAAVLVYLLVKKDNLIGPMLTGWKRGLRAEGASDSIAVRIAGIGLMLALGALAYKVLGW